MPGGRGGAPPALRHDVAGVDERRHGLHPGRRAARRRAACRLLASGLRIEDAPIRHLVGARLERVELEDGVSVPREVLFGHPPQRQVELGCSAEVDPVCLLNASRGSHLCRQALARTPPGLASSALLHVPEHEWNVYSAIVELNFWSPSITSAQFAQRCTVRSPAPSARSALSRHSAEGGGACGTAAAAAGTATVRADVSGEGEQAKRRRRRRDKRNPCADIGVTSSAQRNTGAIRRSPHHPRAYGGSGSYWMYRCTSRANSGVWICPTSQSAMSIPAETPAAVTRFPSRT